MSAQPFRSRRWLEDRAARVLAACPRKGDGGTHKWIFRAALVLLAIHTPEEAAAIIRARLEGYGRPEKRGEIANAIASAGRILGLVSYGIISTRTLSYSAWPKPDEAEIARIAGGGFSVDELRKSSPYQIWYLEYADDILPYLFGSDELVCVAKRNNRPVTVPLREALPFVNAMQFIVPSPMSARRGKSKEGRPTSRSLSNTGGRRFLVIEFDSMSQDTQAAILKRLERDFPLALVVHSGNISLQGWFNIQGVGEGRIREFMARAVMLGADPATFTRCQFVRMPGGRRDNNRFQWVLYFNPAAISPRDL